MRRQTVIFFYTNNLICKDILKTTVAGVIGHAKKNNCELVITSHYPVLSQHIPEKLPSSNVPNAFDIKGNEKSLDKYMVKDLRMDGDGVATNYVVGPQKRAPKTIFDQIILSMERSHGSNIVLMEHDCLYPDNYIPVVNDALNDCDFTYCSKNITFVSWKGYFKNLFLDFYLSSCSGNREIMQAIFKAKRDIFKNNISAWFEPILKKHVEDQNSDMVKEFGIDKREIIVEDYKCIDDNLGDGVDILDIKHKLNYSGLPKFINSDDFSGYYHQHPYWNSSDKYIEMIKSIQTIQG